MRSITTTKLKSLCRTHDISGYSSLRKKELLALVRVNYNQQLKDVLLKLQSM